VLGMRPGGRDEVLFPVAWEVGGVVYVVVFFFFFLADFMLRVRQIVNMEATCDIGMAARRVSLV